MILHLMPDAHEIQEDKPDRNQRRGVTSVEYLFVISLILIACILAVQHVGEVTKAIFTSNADKTKIMDPAQQGP